MLRLEINPPPLPVLPAPVPVPVPVPVLAEESSDEEWVGVSSQSACASAVCGLFLVKNNHATSSVAYQRYHGAKVNDNAPEHEVNEKRAEDASSQGESESQT